MRHHANRGRAWQQAVEDQHAEYARAGRCASIRNEPARTSAWKDDAACEDAIAHGRGAPDYTVLGNHRGVPYAFTAEAKDHAGDHWPLAEVSHWQAQRMDGIVQQGHAALILLRLGGRVFLIEWASVAADWHVARGRGFILTPDDFRLIEVYSADYLDAAISLLPISPPRSLYPE